MGLVIETMDRPGSRCTSSGAGAMMRGVSPMTSRRRSVLPLGGGATTLWSSEAMRRSSWRSTSGAGAMIEFCERAGAARLDFSPSAGGGPGTGLKASRFSTGALETGNFKLGASTTLSRAVSPRATRMVCEAWWACLPPAMPLLPDWAPQKGNLGGQDDCQGQQDRLGAPGEQQTSQREQAGGCLARQGSRGAPQGGPDRGAELLPGRRPLD